jgi:two-component system, cell cycle response regulator DivK
MSTIPRLSQAQHHSCHSAATILAVDDNSDNLLLLSYVLEPLNCKLLVEVDGMQALAKAKTYQPDLILLDIILPGLDGIQIMRQLRQDVHTRHIPVIAVTALSGADNQDNLLLEGFCDYVRKPYDLEELEVRIWHHLNSLMAQKASV